MRLIDADALKTTTIIASYLDKNGYYTELKDVSVVMLKDLETAPCVEVKSMFRAAKDEAVTEIVALITEIENTPSDLMWKSDVCYLIKQRIKAMYNY